MTKGVFITGTDTEIGKTSFTLVLMQTLKNAGYQVAGMKPIASGAEKINGQLQNGDAKKIQSCCSKSITYELINPVVFEQAIAPHLAAAKENKKIDITEIKEAYAQLAATNDFVIVEGVGGWRVPLSTECSLVRLVRELELPVILVVGLRLGCINHALMTKEVIAMDGVPLIGWVSNQPGEYYSNKEDTLQFLQGNLSCSHIADIPYMREFVPDKAVTPMDLSVLPGFT